MPGEMTKQILSAPARTMRSTRYSLTARGRSMPSIKPAADRQQFLREGQRLDAAALPGRGNDAPHRQALRISTARRARFERARADMPLELGETVALVCSASVRVAGARADARRFAHRRSSSAASASSVVRATRISDPAQEGDRARPTNRIAIGGAAGSRFEQAARRDTSPSAAMAARVMFNVSADEEKNAECSTAADGGRNRCCRSRGNERILRAGDDELSLGTERAASTKRVSSAFADQRHRCRDRRDRWHTSRGAARQC